MIRFEVTNNTDHLYLKNVFTFKEGVNILIGKNGSGKSTLINQIKDYCEYEKIIYNYFDTESKNSTSVAMEKALYSDSIEIFATLATSSEGQKVIVELYQEMSSILHKVKKSKPGDKVVFLFDAIDSGLSIDAIITIKELFNTMVTDSRLKDREVYIIAAANSYELCEGFSCINVTDAKRHKFKSYPSYKKFILESEIGGIENK